MSIPLYQDFVKANQSSTGSNIAIVPAYPLPAYSASKAALNVFTLCLREQLSETNVKVIEVSPPPVQSKSVSVTNIRPFLTNVQLRYMTDTWAKRQVAS